MLICLFIRVSQLKALLCPLPRQASTNLALDKALMSMVLHRFVNNKPYERDDLL